MIAIARAGGRGLDIAGLSEFLDQSPEEAGELIANLAAGGLVRMVGAATHGDPRACGRTSTFRLSRIPEDIGLDEIARVADAGSDSVGAGARAPVSAAAAGTRLLQGAMARQALGALARFTLADVLAPETPRRVDSASRDCASGRAGSGVAVRGRERIALERLGITVNDLLDCVDVGEEPVVLDVRSRPSARHPAPPWAHWIALEDLTDHVHDWPLDTRIVTVCRLGVRSLIAASYLRLRGFSRADPLIGGLDAWHRELLKGGPTSKIP